MSFLRELNHRRIDSSKALLLKIIRYLFDQKTSFVESKKSIHLEAMKRALILHFDDKIGDLVINTPIFRELSKAAPHLQIDLVTGHNAAPLIQNNPYIKDIILFHKGLWPTLRLARILYSNNYDLVIDLRLMTDSRTIYILNRLGLNQNTIRVGLNKSQYSVYDLTVEKDFLKTHARERTKTLLQLIGLSEPNMNYDLHFGEKDLAIATDGLKRLDSSNKTLPFIILNPFAGARFRSFNFDSVKRLSTHIHQALPNHRIIVTGSPNDSDFLLNCQKELSNLNVFYIPNVKSLSELCALVSLANGVVTPDTSLVHIASAYNKNIIAFFRDDSLDLEQNSKQWAPKSSNAQVILCTGKTNGYLDVNTFEDSAFKTALTSFLTGKSL